MNKLSFAFTSLAVLLVLTGCTPKIPNVDGGTNAPTKVIKIGVIAPLSGPAATYGEDVTHAYTMALDAYKQAGKLADLDVQFVFEDGRCTGKDATAAAQKLINVDKVVAILGGVCSSETIPAGELAQSSGIPLVSAVSSAPSISQMGDYIFRFYNDLDQAEAIAEYLLSLDAGSVALLYENTDYGIGLANALKADLSGKVTVDVDVKFNTDEKDFSLVAKAVGEKMSTLDAVIVIPNNDATSISTIQALDSEGVLDNFDGIIVGGEAFVTNSVVAAVGEKAEGLQGTLLPVPTVMGPQAVDFLEEFKRQYEVKSSDQFVTLWYESANLMLDAVINGIDATGIKSYLEGITKAAPRSGYFGDYYLDENGDAVGLSFIIGQISSGTLLPLE